MKECGFYLYTPFLFLTEDMLYSILLLYNQVGYMKSKNNKPSNHATYH